MYFRANQKRNNDVLLSDSIGFDKEGNEISLIDVLEDNTEDYVEIINQKDNINMLKKYLNLLSDKEKEIIKKRYGLNGEEEKTQKEIAKELNISRSYVSRIEKRALSKILKEFMKDKKTL